MIGPRYWATGITVRHMTNSDGQETWAAYTDFYDDGFCSDDADTGRISTEGQLRTRYMVKPGDTVDALTAAINTVLADAERLGIAWNDPTIYYEGDGENPEWPPPPGWQAAIGRHVRRLDWRPLYGGVQPPHATR